MADMYGPSQAELAGKSAAAFQSSSTANLNALNDQIKKIAAELTAGITTGMTAQEIADKQNELDALKNQADQVIKSTQGGFKYVQQEAGLSAEETARQLAAAQTQAAQVAAANLARQATGGAPSGLYRPSVADATRSQQAIEAATQAYLGGTPSVGAELLPRVQGMGESTGATLGLSGITSAGSTAFSRAMSAVEQRALQEVERDKLVLGASIQNQYQKEARDREARQRQSAEAQIAQLTQLALTQQAQSNQTLAQLEAAAAGADTRTGREKAMADLATYKEQQRIQHNYTLQEIAARGQDAGLSASEIAQKQALVNQSAGRNTYLNDMLTSSQYQTYVASLPKKPVGSNPGFYTDGITVYYAQQGAETKKVVPINAQDLQTTLIEQAGAARNLPTAKLQQEAFTKWYSQLDPASKLYLKDTLSYIADSTGLVARDSKTGKTQKYNWSDPKTIFRFVMLPSAITSRS